VIVCVAPNFSNSLKMRREIIMKMIKFLLATLLSIAVVTCGGGGGGGGNSISGRVTLTGVAHQIALSGVTISLAGASTATTTTAVDGSYYFTGLANGSYTVMPSLSSFTFSPTNIAITSLAVDSTENNFVAAMIP
jgi:hypothetical protein